MFTMLCGEVCRLFIVAPLSTHRDCGIKVKFEVAGRFDEFFQFINIFQFSIAVQKQSGMVSRCFMVFMKFLKILDQIMDALSIKVLRMLATSPNWEEGAGQTYFSNHL